jgi:hypothetical protein
MATENNNIYTDDGSVSTNNGTIDGENVACVFTEKPTCIDANRKSRSISTTNLSNNRYSNYRQGVYYTVTKFQTSGTDTLVDYEYSRLFAKILDVFFIHKNSNVLSDDQLKLLSKFADTSYNTFTMPLDVIRLDQFLGAFREY